MQPESALGLIPFNHASSGNAEMAYVTQAIRSGRLSGDGPFTKRCQEFLEKSLGAPKVFLTTSCTSALEMSALLLDIQPDDEVILPSFTFVSTANAYVLRQARPIFCDIRSDTLNLDERKLESLITPRTRAIVPVHYAGVGCAMDEIQAIAVRYGLAVVEDNAHGLFGKYRGRNLGTIGCMGTQSFHETKNYVCGEGGALVINNPVFIQRAEIIREKGTDRSRFFRGQVDKYSWVDIGSSFLPSDILAAFLLGQFDRQEEIHTNRKNLWQRYQTSLTGWAKACGSTLPTVPDECDQTYHMFYLLLPSLRERQNLITHLKERSIQSAFHYLPLHLSEMGRTYGGREGDCPVTEEVSDRLVRLPLFSSLTEMQQNRIIEAVASYKC